MTSSRKNHWDEVMEGVNKTLPAKAADYHGPKTLSDILLDPPEPPAVKPQSIRASTLASPTTSTT